MQKNKSLLNIFASIIFRLVVLAGNFIVRRYLIRFAGNDINGINSLYISIIGVLSVAELGIGDAIVFCMYKPIVRNDIAKVSSLYKLFKRIYVIIGLFIFIFGCGVTAVLPYLAKGYASLNINMGLTFELMLISTVLTYFFSAKISLMNAYRDNYIATTVNSLGQLLQQGLQIVALFLTKSFELYLLCRIISVSVQWLITNIITKKRYPAILKNTSFQIDQDTKQTILKNVKALFTHKIGSILVNTIDSLVISTFIGVAMLGKYSNYIVIITAMTSVISLCFTPLTSTIGHLFIRDKCTFKKYYDFFHTVNFMLGCTSFLVYYSIINNLIGVFFGAGLTLSKSTSIVITLNYFIQFMRQSTMVFRDASGTFYYDRWKPLLEGISNLILSILFVKIFQKSVGDDFAMLGVIVATIMTNLFICHIVEPFVVYKYVFHASAKKYYLKNYSYIILFAVALIILDLCMITNDNTWNELLINGLIAIGISTIPFIWICLFNKNFKYYAKNILKKEVVKI